MLRIVVAFTTREGQTGRIAHHIARRIEDSGHTARLIDVGSRETEAGADDSDGVIVAGSIHRGRYDPRLSDFIVRHGETLRRVPSAFLSVSLSAASTDPGELAAIDEIAQALVAEAGWQPDMVQHVAGAVHDRTLNPLERQVLHDILDQRGVTRHPSGDTELTDWPEVDTFVTIFLAQVREAAPKARPRSAAQLS
jgi:menaquinone-dependent protoporphyrinogen oxidase